MASVASLPGDNAADGKVGGVGSVVTGWMER